VSEEVADKASIVSVTGKQARLEQDLSDANDVNAIASAAFNKNQKNHNNMVEAL
jgi:hypothetical protein